MNNQQLLELAAKAIGLQGAYCEWYEMGEQFYWGIRDGRTWGAWNPLEDDGDALRLAIRLSLNIYLGGPGSVVTGRQGIPGIRREFSDDSNSAVRRAIVQAAAAIGDML